MKTCHKNGPPKALADWPSSWEETHLNVKETFELPAPELRRLMRLRPNYMDADGWIPRSRVDFMTVAAREALSMGNCEVVGGFIRDWIIGGDSGENIPKDIDLRLWKDFDIEEYVRRCYTKWGLVRDHRGFKLGFSTPNRHWFSIDYIFEETHNQDGLDFDVNAFAVSPDEGLHKRTNRSRPIGKIHSNIKRKVAYLVDAEPKHGERCLYLKKRVEKMQGRGWKVLKAQGLECHCAQLK